MKKINLTSYELAEIVDCYNEYKSLFKVSKKFNMSKSTLKRRLNEIGINTTLDVDALRKKKIIYNIDENYFASIDTSDKAYILGLLYADGHMFSSRKQVRLKLTDVDLLEKVKNKMNYLKPLNHNKRLKDTHKESKTLIICNTKIYDDLISLGCGKNKTFNCYKLPKLKKELMNDFIRGFFDGDGCIYVGVDKRNNNIVGEVVIISTNQFINEIINYLGDNGILAIYFRDKKHDKRIGKLRIRQHESLVKFYLLMYGKINENSIYLDRKYNKYKNFLKNKNLI